MQSADRFRQHYVAGLLQHFAVFSYGIRTSQKRTTVDTLLKNQCNNRRVEIYTHGWHGGNGLSLYLGSTWFEYQLGYRLS